MELSTIGTLNQDVSDAYNILGDNHLLAFEIVDCSKSYMWGNYKVKILSELNSFLKDVEDAGTKIKQIDKDIKSYNPKFGDYNMTK